MEKAQKKAINVLVEAAAANGQEKVNSGYNTYLHCPDRGGDLDG